jgi:hypothetical protein
MRATTDSDTALHLLQQEHAETKAIIAELSDDEMTRPNTIRYGLYPDDVWSFRDLLAHMTAYEHHALNATDAFRQGEKHLILDRVVGDGYRVHKESVSDYVGRSLAEMVAEYESNAEALESLVSEADDAQWREVAAFDANTDFGGVIERILVLPPRPLYRHLPVHIPDMDAYIRWIGIAN